MGQAGKGLARLSPRRTLWRQSWETCVLRSSLASPFLMLDAPRRPQVSPCRVKPPHTPAVNHVHRVLRLSHPAVPPTPHKARSAPRHYLAHIIRPPSTVKYQPAPQSPTSPPHRIPTRSTVRQSTSRRPSLARPSYHPPRNAPIACHRCPTPPPSLPAPRHAPRTAPLPAPAPAPADERNGYRYQRLPRDGLPLGMVKHQYGVCGSLARSFATRCCVDWLFHIGFAAGNRINPRETAEMKKSRLPIMRQSTHKKARRDYPKIDYGILTEILPVFADPKRRARFEGKIDRSGGPDACHPWRGGALPLGYGLTQGCIAYQGYSFLVHRVAWALANDREPGDAVIRHSCDNPPCCNPKHLLSGTHKDNSRDMIERGRHGRGGPRGRFGAAANAADYSQAQRDEAIRLRFTERWLIRHIAERIGAHPATIRRWLAEHVSR